MVRFREIKYNNEDVEKYSYDPAKAKRSVRSGWLDIGR